MTLFDFAKATASRPWHAIDDRVMGGVSRSELINAQHDQQPVGLFRGAVSLDHNGGFCSVRAALDAPLATEIEHLWIDCQNNGQWGSKTYFLNLRISDGIDGVNYRAAFTPGDRYSRYEFTVADFAPVFRGRSVPDAPALCFARVQQLGLMIADSQVGPFELFIKKIGVLTGSP